MPPDPPAGTPGRRLDGLRGRVRRERAEHRALALASGLLDPEWIGVQLDRPVRGLEQAADAVVAAEESDGPLSPHPLVELAWARPGQPWLREGVPSLVWWLRATQRRETMPPHPLVDVREIGRRDPAATRHPGGPLAAWLTTATPDSLLPVPAGQPSVTLAAARAAALAAQMSYASMLRPAPGPPVVVRPTTTPAEPGAPDLSIVVVARDAAVDLRATVASLQASRLGSWEVLVVDDASTDDTAAVLAGLAHFEPRVVALRGVGAGFAAAAGVALDAARGRLVAFLDAGRVTPPALYGDLVAAVDASTGWPAAVADTSAGVVGLTQLTAGAGVDPARFVVRRDLALQAGGLDPTLERAAPLDLLLRVTAGGGVPQVATASLPGGAPDRPGPGAQVLLDRHLVDRDHARVTQAGSTSVVVQARDGVGATVRWIRAALADGRPGQLVVVGARPTRTHHVVAHTLAAASEHVECHFVAAPLGPPSLSNLGLLHASGERVVVVRADVEAVLPELRRLALTLDEPGVALAQPLVLDTDDVVASAGAAFATSALRPEPFLAGHAPRDAPSAPTTIAAPLGPVVAVRRDVVLTLGGLDPAYAEGLPEVALGLRAAAAGLGRTVLDASVVARCPAAGVVGPARLAATAELLGSAGDDPPPVGPEVWAAAGFEVVGVHTEAHELRPDADPLWLPCAVVRPTPPRAERIDQSPPRLRWTIDTAVPAGPGGGSWGDQHFAGSLRDALERRGQIVAVDPRDARDRSGRDHDEVVLVLRGLDRVPPRPGPLRVAWVISHPDLVDSAELASYDLVFAASLSWSADVTARWGVPVVSLLQCTDPALFHPGRARTDVPGRVLFVGNSRGVLRTSLRAALAAGVDVEVHGKGWKEFLGPDRVAGLSIPNAELGTAYAEASVVLNDHWDDMRREGFVSNRVFDAGACGARVLSDEISGLHDVLGPLVATYAPSSPEADVAAILADPDRAFGSRDERLARAEVIRAEHSFDARAATLLNAVADRLAADPA